MLNVASIIEESIVDGLGIRVVVFFQGCSHDCHGCHNPLLQPFELVKEYTVEELGDMILEYLTPLHKGVTFSGGDPMFQPKEVYALIKYLRSKKTDMNIWMYTGFTFEEIKDFPMVREIDVIVDGMFEEALKDLTLKFRGSSNQRVIDIMRTFMVGHIVEIKL